MHEDASGHRTGSRHQLTAGHFRNNAARAELLENERRVEWTIEWYSLEMIQASK
jgi:hypothetical protein